MVLVVKRTVEVILYVYLESSGLQCICGATTVSRSSLLHSCRFITVLYDGLVAFIDYGYMAIPRSDAAWLEPFEVKKTHSSGGQKTIL